VLNAANELAVKAFLEEKIPFIDICEVVKETLKHHRVMENPSLEDILNADKWSRGEAKRIINSRSEVGI